MPLAKTLSPNRPQSNYTGRRISPKTAIDIPAHVIGSIRFRRIRKCSNHCQFVHGVGIRAIISNWHCSSP